MSGLYIHIPFCIRRCLYCDFFSNTEMKYKAAYLDAVGRELALRKDYITDHRLETIYFGGGTPSQFTAADFESIFEHIQRHFDISACREVTLEANPDDMTSEYVRSLRPLPFNRISMGVQSFDGDDLVFLNRRHTANQAVQAVQTCRDNGFTNISIDLIYGLPGQTRAKWEKNLEAFLRLDLPHLSAYHLIYEEDTELYRRMAAGTVRPIDEDLSVELFSYMIDCLNAAGYTQYEISNFARPGCLSQHNSSYWKGVEYLGIGPSAHSYNGANREWNVSSLPLYLQGIQSGSPVTEVETLDKHTSYNDFIITRLRTIWGIHLPELRRLFGEAMADYCLCQAQSYLQTGLLHLDKDTLTLSRQGVFISDRIMSDLLWV